MANVFLFRSKCYWNQEARRNYETIESVFPMAKTLLTPEKTMNSEIDQFHKPFLNSLVKVVLVTLFLMIFSSFSISLLYNFYKTPTQTTFTSSENAGN